MNEQEWPIPEVMAENPGYVELFKLRRSEGKPIEAWELWKNHGRTKVIDRFTDPSWLYIVRVQGTIEPIKIGRSIDAAHRIKSIPAPGPLEPLAMVPEWVCSEREAHARWAYLHQHREWFRVDAALLEWISKLSLRWAALAPLRDRAVALVAERAARRRPLGGLVVVEAQLHEEAMRRCGCALCRTTSVVVTRCSALPGRYLCQSCGTWLRESLKAGGPEEVRTRYKNAVDFAIARLEKHEVRLARLAELQAEMAR